MQKKVYLCFSAFDGYSAISHLNCPVKSNSVADYNGENEKDSRLLVKICRTMKITVFLLIVGLMNVYAIGTSQNISLSGKQISLKVVFAEVEKQTDYVVFYNKKDLGATNPVSVSVKEMPINEFLYIILKDQPITYTIEDRTIMLWRKEINHTIPVKSPVEIIYAEIAGVLLNGNNNDPVAGGSLTVKGRKTGTASDNNGYFKLGGLDKDAILIISCVGFKNVELAVAALLRLSAGENLKTDNAELKKAADGSLIINLVSSEIKMTEVVVIGYGTQNRKDITTSVASLKAADINNFPATGLDKALTGKLAGVQVLQPGGAPGAGISIMIRGRGTITAGSDPLYVVDGMPLSDNGINGPGIKVNPLNAINVNDIESVDILKDASAAAIYGSRGANGVVLITTKRGKANKPDINFNSYYGLQSVSKKIDMLNAYQYAQLIYDAHNNTYFDLLADKNLTGNAADNNATRLAKLGGAATNTSLAYLLPPEIDPYLKNEPGLTDTDWQDEIFRTAPMQNYAISAAGGSGNIRYYISGNYLDQDGIVVNSGYKKYGGRINLDANYKRLKLGASVNYNQAIYNYQQTEGRFNGNLENIVSGALIASPFFSVYKNDNYNYDQFKWQYSQAQLINPVALAMLKDDRMAENKFIGNVFAEYEIIKDLKYKLSFGAEMANSNRDIFRPSTLPGTVTLAAPSVPVGTYRSAVFSNWIIEHTLNYSKRIGEHSLRLLGGFSSQKERRDVSNVTGSGYPNDLIKTLNAATTVTGWNTNINEWSLMSVLGRAQYSFKDRYLLSAAIRTDGSSRFGPNNRWGYFPSASAGWNISDEDFMKEVKQISSLKLRASYGITGNFQIGNYAYLGLMSPSNYVFGGSGSMTLSPGLYQNTAANAELGWEKTSAVNIGAEIGLFNDKLQLVVDVYNNNTNDLLLDVPVPQSSGFSTSLVNIGKVNNKGIEFTLSSRSDLGKFSITNSANFSLNKNKVLDLGGVNSIITQAQSVIYFITQVGKPVANYYTLVQTGIYKNQAEISDPKNAVVAGAKPGDFKFKDVNKDGKIDGSNDREITGSYMPKFIYGFSSQMQYGILELAVSLQGVYGNKIANVNQRHMNATESYANNTTEALNRYVSPDQPGDGRVARANRSQRGLNATISTYHLSDASYLRIRDITLGIKLPQQFIRKAGLTNARLYITGQNLLTFTKYNSYNPEVSIDDNPMSPGIDYGSYPLSKTVFVGINLNF